MSSNLDGVNMIGNQFHKQVQEGISRWLESGKKCGLVELDSERAALSSVLGKRSENQDRAIFFRVKFDESRKPSIAALVLCDGMGGMVSGADCANLAISTFAATLVHSNAPKLIDRLNIAVSDANQAVYNVFQGKGGATLSAVVCDETSEWAGINVGDSRIYALLNSGLVEQLTIDDTLEKQLEDLNLPSPPPEFRQLLQYVGMGKGIEPRLVKTEKFSEFKWLLITSDGAHNIPNNVFQALVNTAKVQQDAAFRLTELSEWLGGKDNATVATLAIGDNLFLRGGDRELSSLEVWGIPGKIEFLSIKPLRTETPINGSSINNINAVGSEEIFRQEVQPQKKPQKKKNHNNTSKADLKGTNGNKNSSAGKGEADKPVPQLNIEFSEES